MRFALRQLVGWLLYLAIPVVMVYGHYGSRLDWTQVPISLYAVHAPHHHAITAAMRDRVITHLFEDDIER